MKNKRKSPLMMSNPMIGGMCNYKEMADANAQLNIDMPDDKPMK
ncbi:hypothetical protein [Thermoanaerobacterium sp. RBIITD]|nr:hypothetical protein [Thermoanaerobacterium sp. RBIITD]